MMLRGGGVWNVTASQERWGHQNTRGAWDQALAQDRSLIKCRGHWLQGEKAGQSDGSRCVPALAFEVCWLSQVGMCPAHFHWHTNSDGELKNQWDLFKRSLSHQTISFRMNDPLFWQLERSFKSSSLNNNTGGSPGPKQKRCYCSLNNTS